AQKRLIAESEAREAQIRQALNIQRVLDVMLHLSLPSLSLTEVLDKSLDAVLSIPAFSLLNTGAIFLTANDGETLEMVAQKNLPDALLHSCAMLPFGKCLCGRAAASREIVYFNHLNEAHEISYEGMQPHGHYCIPIMLEGQVLGVLNTYVADGHVSSETERKYLETVADTLALVVEHKQGELRLEQLAHNDNLTGLPNRALFYDRLEHWLALAQRNQKWFAVLFLDLDHFKEVNDTYGHDIGDLLLREAAIRLLGCVRKEDTVARMGGDEFTVILIEMKTVAGVEYVAKKILKAMQQPFEFNGVTCNIGCSIGVALYPAHGMDSETLLKNADLAMYHAKRQRNIFYIFNDDLL
ncbi:MAG: sensor domain-containing diguanylate cyclase, partial [Gammaproteobacteria bacterium]|nr:sensor domain-containing diguanylate cyclase [Gammaproteobacteria bacterium]